MNNKFHNRKPMRLKQYDYSQNGAYFITFCTDKRRNILGKILVGDGVIAPYKGAITPSPTNSTIPMLISTYKRLVNKDIGFNIWQRSYFDHIIRNENEYLEKWQYIENNPYKWEEDDYYNE
ncbi:MAG: transposase [Ruminococcus sp.]